MDHEDSFGVKEGPADCVLPTEIGSE